MLLFITYYLRLLCSVGAVALGWIGATWFSKLLINSPRPATERRFTCAMVKCVLVCLVLPCHAPRHSAPALVSVSAVVAAESHS